MAGRKRKAGKREPNGRPQRENVVDIMAVVLNQPHRRSLAEKDRRDQRAECEIGRLCLTGLVDMRCYDAAVEYRKIVGRLRVALDSPKPDPRSMALGLASGQASEIDEECAARWRRDYTEAYRVLMSSDRNPLHSRKITMSINKIVVRDNPGFHQEIEMAKVGLKALADFWGFPSYDLTAHAKHATGQK